MRVQTDLNGLIEERGGEFAHTTKLEVPINVTSLDGIERFDRIERLKIKRKGKELADEPYFEDDPKIDDYSPLATNSLTRSIRVLSFRGNSNLVDISFLRGYRVLEELDLYECTGILDYSPLESESLRATIRKLRWGPTNHQYTSGTLDISFLVGYQVLEELDMESCGTKDFSVLEYPALKRTLRSIAIANDDSIPDLSDFQHLEEIFIADNGTGEFSSCSDNTMRKTIPCLNSSNLKRTVRRLTLEGFYNLNDISFLDGYQRLRSVFIGHCPILDYSPLESKSLKRTVMDLSLKTHSLDPPLSEDYLWGISFLTGYSKLERLVIEGFRKIGDYSPLDSEHFRNRMKELSLKDNNGFSDMSPIKGYRILRKLNIDGTSVRDISDLLDYEFVRNGSLREITLPNSIDWTIIRNGRYVGEHIVRTLKDRGVKVNLPSTFSFNNDERPRKSLQEYLSGDLNICQHDIDLIHDWFQKDRLWKRMPFEEQIRFVDEQSFHETFEVETAQGGELILKVQPSRLKAEIEQVANYYLSPVFGFIAPTDCREPFEYCGLYLTVQDRVEGGQAEIRDLPYHLACLAKLHAHGKEIMEGNGITLPIKEIPEFLEVYEVIRYAAHRHPDVSRSRIKERQSEYEESRHKMMDGKQVLLHGDLKKQNRLGRYFLDLEGICTGDSTLDLATVLNDCKMYLGDQKRAYLSIYQHFYAKETGTEFREEDVDRLLDRLKGAELVRGTQSIAWNLVYINEEGETAREKLLYLSQSMKPK